MSRYIDAADEELWLKSKIDQLGNVSSSYCIGYRNALIMVLETVSNWHPSDIYNNTGSKGYWIDMFPERCHSKYYECSRCGITQTREYDYCPKCGADMGEENKPERYTIIDEMEKWHNGGV